MGKLQESGEWCKKLPGSIYAKPHMTMTLPDSNTRLVFDNQEKNDNDQNDRCGYNS